MNKYPQYIMAYLRQRKGLQVNDTSIDNELDQLTPEEVFSEVCIWNGLLGGWDIQIKNWILDIYGINIDDHVCVSSEDENRC